MTLYEPADVVMVRAPLLPLAARGSMHRSGEIDCAIAVGSLPYLDALESVRAAPDVERTLRRYVTRMATRATPFGLFAGVALGEWAERTDLELAPGPRRRRTRPDMAWLMRVVDDAEADPAIRRELRVVANPAAYVRAGRVVLAERVGRGEARPPEVSIRATGVVRRALAEARSPVGYMELAARLLALTPAATGDRVERLLAQLCEQTLLLTDLRPPLTVPDPARHVIDRLAAIPAADGIRSALEDVVAAAAAWDASTAPPRASEYRAIVRRAAALAPSERSPLHVDSALQLRGRRVARLVAEEAARAAELLLRLSPIPRGPAWLAAYRAMFERRYGTHREVPLLELLDPDAGLGAPPLQQAAGDPAAARRAEALTELAATALREGLRCVELDARTLQRLTPADPAADALPASLDLQVVVAAASRPALDAGDFQLVVGANVGSMAAGRTLGRFADMLPGAPAALRRIADAEEAVEPGKIRAELAYAPRSPGLGNVSVRPNVRTYEIAVGVSPGVEPSRAIPVDELLVGVRDGRFSVRWARSPQELAITAGHMLNSARAPVLCRFLSAVGHDSTCHLSAFQWGPASSLPFLPRVQSGRIVLALARWRIAAASLGERGDGFPDALARWRARWDVPERVALTAGDARLLLDLTVPGDADELRRALGRGDGTAVVTEVFPDGDRAWLQDGEGRRFASELVVPLIRRRRAAPLARGGARRASPAAAPDLRPPGGDWLFAKLYTGRDAEDDLLAGPVRAFCEEARASGFAESFFIRYGDPGRHVRLRFHGPPERLTTELLPRVCAWAGGLVEDGRCLRLVLDTYEREVERFGGPDGLRAAEAFFAADSRAVLELLDRMRRHAVALPPLPLAVLTVEALLDGLGLDAEAQARWCAHRVGDRRESGGDYREWKGRLRPLLAGRPVDDGVGDLLLETRGAARALAEALGRSPHELAASLVHLHLNRLLAADMPLERRVIGLLGRVRHGLAAPASGVALEFPPGNSRPPATMKP